MTTKSFIKTSVAVEVHPHAHTRHPEARGHVPPLSLGERAMIKDNHLLGTFDLTGIPPAPRGVPQIEVTFELDTNGILSVSAEDKGSGSKNKITITNEQNRLSEEEMRRMVDDAERFADEDRKLKERVDARNELESYAYSLKNQLGDRDQLGGKLSDSDQEAVLKALEEKLQWVETHQEADAHEFRAMREKLEEELLPIIGKLHDNADRPPPMESKETKRDEL